MQIFGWKYIQRQSPPKYLVVSFVRSFPLFLHFLHCLVFLFFFFSFSLSRFFFFSFTVFIFILFSISHNKMNQIRYVVGKHLEGPFQYVLKNIDILTQSLFFVLFLFLSLSLPLSHTRLHFVLTRPLRLSDAVPFRVDDGVRVGGAAAVHLPRRPLKLTDRALGGRKCHRRITKSGVKSSVSSPLTEWSWMSQREEWLPKNCSNASLGVCGTAFTSL